MKLQPGQAPRMPFGPLQRREFITLLGSAAAAWPLRLRAQQPAMPVIGHLDAGSPASVANLMTNFRQGLAEAGYVDGQNVTLLAIADEVIDQCPVSEVRDTSRHGLTMLNL